MVQQNRHLPSGYSSNLWKHETSNRTLQKDGPDSELGTLADKTARDQGKVLVLGGQQLPASIESTLRKGPKFACEPDFSPPEKDLLRGLAGGLRRRRVALLLLLLLGAAVAWRTAWREDVAARRCPPRPAAVCFVKTHKCASSSVQNVLLRYGDRRGLRFVLPPRTNYLGHPRLFHRSMAPGRPPFDVLAHHARFHEAEMRAVLRPRPRFLTIVREPASLFESLYSYYDLRDASCLRTYTAASDDLLAAQTKTRLSLEQLASGNRSLSARLARKRTRSKLGFNQMSFDLGLEPAQFANASAVRRFVERLDATFDLVMVAERINESLVLLGDLLCGDVDDVVVFRHNARQTRRPPSGRLAAQLRELNAADVQLYEHFARRLEQRVRRFGPRRMARELRLLEQRTRHWHERCVRDTRPADGARGFWVSAKVLMFRPKNDSSEECARMMLPELVFTERLRKKQSGNATRSH
ncbi:galactosylceramide sulfotransferase-like [Dermacentor variabilis]|uniref:galactosylceramide sulfotransferase-like n=1 Tax=Dermacentor variabilis TaxID=34621 RepID=UPI003F5BDAD0